MRFIKTINGGWCKSERLNLQFVRLKIQFVNLRALDGSLTPFLGVLAVVALTVTLKLMLEIQIHIACSILVYVVLII